MARKGRARRFREARELKQAWLRHGPRIPLEVDDAPYRDVGGPLLEYLRELTAEEGTEVLVLLPELIALDGVIALQFAGDGAQLAFRYSTRTSIALEALQQALAKPRVLTDGRLRWVA